LSDRKSQITGCATAANVYVRRSEMVRPPDQSIDSAQQRIRVEMDRQRGCPQVKICVESFDAGLGWYSSGALELPLHQLPLLEQAIAEMRRNAAEHRADIIPFPGTSAQQAAAVDF
jgi:hypothetical protein